MIEGCVVCGRVLCWVFLSWSIWCGVIWGWPYLETPFGMVLCEVVFCGGVVIWWCFDFGWGCPGCRCWAALVFGLV